MNFKIEELGNDEKYLEIRTLKNSFSDFKKSYTSGSLIVINFDDLNLGTRLYGKNQKETKNVQRQNCKQFLKMYRLCKKVIKFLKRKKFNFDGALYVAGLGKKKNNNDYMLVSMLELRFCTPLTQKFLGVINSACDFIDKENSLNSMCEFKGNKCRKQRENNLDKVNGCCVPSCKYSKEGSPCPTKCLSCKIFMCKYLTDMGYCFYPSFMPILKVHTSFFERFVILGSLFRSQKQTIGFLRFIRLIYVVYIAMIVLLAFILGYWVYTLIV